MQLIDSHTHLYLPEFDEDRREVVQRAVENGVVKMLLPNIDSSTIDNVLKMCNEYPDACYPMAGLHPTSVNKNFREELKYIESWLSGNEFIGIGETGMDLYWDKTYREEQKEVFKTQIGWSKKYNLPIVIHCRDAFQEIYEVMDREFFPGLTGVFHSFTGTREDVKKISEYDFYYGINGIVTFKNSGLADVVKEIPPERLLIETDSPFLSPVPKRGKRNESANVKYIFSLIAEIHGFAPSAFEKIVKKNTLDLFRKLKNE